MAETDGDEGLDDLPPSAKLVYKVLEYDGPLTQKGIVEESMLSARTVRYALERLEEIGVVDEDVYFADARQNLYQLTAPIEADGGVDGDEETGDGADAEDAPPAECD
jgi:DNA-binding MarR family transcriptional regulator